VLHHTDARDRQTPLARARRLPVLLEQLVEQASTCRVGEGLNTSSRPLTIRDHMVTCQGLALMARPFIVSLAVR
jgi:hypothetical protein